MKGLFSFSWFGIYPELFLLLVYLIFLIWLLCGFFLKGKIVIYKEACTVFATIFLAVVAELVYVHHDFRFLILKLTLLTLPLLLMWFPVPGGGDFSGAAREAAGGNRFPGYCVFIWAGAFLLDTGRLYNEADTLLWVYLYAFSPIAAAFLFWCALVADARRKDKEASPKVSLESSPDSFLPPEYLSGCPPLRLLLFCLFGVVLYTAIDLSADVRNGEVADGVPVGTIPGAAVLLLVQLLCTPSVWEGILRRFSLFRTESTACRVSEKEPPSESDVGKRYGRGGFYSCPAEEGKCKKYGRDGTPVGRINDLLEDSADEDAVIMRRLIHYFEKDKPFLNPYLKIGEVALQIYTNKTYLSRALNRKMAKNFNQFVNYFRIREACRMFMECPGFRAQELCDKCGFNSISSFSTAFRINTGYSPAEWCKEVKSKLNNDESVLLDEYFI